MSQQNKNTLQANINNDLANNTSGAITAADVRDNMISITDSLLFNSGSQTITGSLIITDGVEITGSVNVDGNIIATSFTGDGSGITGVTIADGSITNVKLVNDSVILGTTEVNLGDTSTTLVGLTLTGAKATGSFTGSFAGDGSALTGITNTPFPYNGAAIITGSLLVNGSGVTVTGSINLDTNNTTTNYLNVGTSDNWVRTFYNGSGNLIQFVDFRSGYDQVNTISTTEIEILDNIPSNANANSLKVGSTLIAGSPAAIYFGMIQNQGSYATRLVFDDAGSVSTDSTLIIPTNTGNRTIALKDEGYLVANLPTGTLGDRAYVTDATSPTYLGTLTGGGAVKCPVFYNGSAWVSA